MINTTSLYSPFSNLFVSSHFSLNQTTDFSLINKIKQTTHSIFNRLNQENPPKNSSTNVKSLAMFAVVMIAIVGLSAIWSSRKPTMPSSPDPKITKKHL